MAKPAGTPTNGWQGLFFGGRGCDLPGFFERFLPSPGFSPFSETVKKAELSYWKETSFDTFHDFGLACELILSSHIDSEFSMDGFIEKSTYEVEVGIENYSDLVPND